MLLLKHAQAARVATFGPLRMARVHRLKRPREILAGGGRGTKGTLSLSTGRSRGTLSLGVRHRRCHFSVEGAALLTDVLSPDPGRAAAPKLRGPRKPCKIGYGLADIVSRKYTKIC
jgi:hypothetical protein